MREWWTNAVFYEIYVRSFADSNGDGIGDLPGITQRLSYLQDLAVDALWLTPFYPSPGADHGYDVADYVDVDPLFGNLDDFDELLGAAHALDLRVIVDIVPNHTSSAHPWFAEDRSRYVTAPGGGGLPNNWPSNFGGPAWTLDEERDEYYLHLFAPEQPDLDWHNPQVRADFDVILRFWLDRGVDGFRIDVAQALVKDAALADEPEPFPLTRFSSDWRTAIDRPEVHDIYRDWRRLVDSYDGERVLVAEIVFSDQTRVAPYLRPDELQLAFNFSLVFQDWNADAIRASIDASVAALPIVTWVLENHDVTRIVSRFGEREARAAALLRRRGVQHRRRNPRSAMTPTPCRSTARRSSDRPAPCKPDTGSSRDHRLAKGMDAACRFPGRASRRRARGCRCRSRGASARSRRSSTIRSRRWRSTAARSSCGRAVGSRGATRRRARSFSRGTTSYAP